MIDTYDVDYTEGEPLKAIAFIYPTPYATTTASNHVKENEGTKEWLK
mgnify:CR=1 FL=1